MSEALAAAQTRGELEATRAGYERALAVAPADVSEDLDSLSRTKRPPRRRPSRRGRRAISTWRRRRWRSPTSSQAARDTLNVKQAARDEWAEAHQAQKDAAMAAQAELARRGQLDEPETAQPDVVDRVRRPR